MERAYYLFESKKPKKADSSKQLVFPFDKPVKKKAKSLKPKKKVNKFPPVSLLNHRKNTLNAIIRIFKDLQPPPDDYTKQWEVFPLEGINAATYDKAKRFQNNKNYKSAFWTVEKYVPKEYKSALHKLLNELLEFTIRDFKFQGSNLTKKFRKERNKVLGQEVKVAKLVDFDFNTNRAIFITKPTFLSQAQTINPSTNTASIDKTYTMEVQFIDLEKWKDSAWKDLSLKEFREILTACDVKLACDCPSHTFQGHRYNLTQIDSAIYPMNIPDPIWRQNHQGKGGLCKHLLGLVNDFGLMSSIILGQIKKRAELKNIQN